MSVYEQMKAKQSYLDQLMAQGGQSILDRQIQKMKEQIGEEQFIKFSKQYFSNTVNFDDDQPIKQQKLQQPADNNLIEDIDLAGSTIPEEGDLYEEIQRQHVSGIIYKIKYNNGDSYQGQFENQMKNGWGEYYYSTGERYSGLFVDDSIHGYGRYYFLSGANFQGDWIQGMKQGHGILKFANGDQYSGGFYKDQFHGKGVYKYINGDCFEGYWKFGKREGKGTFTGQDGRLIIGNWKADKFDL